MHLFLLVSSSPLSPAPPSSPLSPPSPLFLHPHHLQLQTKRKKYQRTENERNIRSHSAKYILQLVCHPFSDTGPPQKRGGGGERGGQRGATKWGEGGKAKGGHHASEQHQHYLVLDVIVLTAKREKLCSSSLRNKVSPLKGSPACFCMFVPPPLELARKYSRC